ncbi:MAG: tetratricopeptide repeat protein [Arenicellales bacterium WSBS_2016_MAG_OTU3]
MCSRRRVADPAYVAAISSGQPPKPTFVKTSVSTLLVVLSGIFLASPIQAQQIRHPVATVSVEDVTKATSFKQVDALIASGAFGLAERHLLNQRPPLSQKSVWMRWEQRLWALYRQHGNWQQLVDRADRLPADLPQEFLLNAGVNKVVGHLRLQQPERARKIATHILWQNDYISADAANSLRRLIVRSYLAETLNDEARIAALRLQREFNPVDENWITVYARTLLQTDRPDLVTRELSSSTLPVIRQLLTLSRLRDGSLTPNQIIELSLMRIHDEAKDEADLASWWSIAAEAARRGRNTVMRVRALEEVLNLPADSGSVLNTLVDNNVLDLLNAYQELALVNAQKAELENGQYTAWMTYADSVSTDSPSVSRAIFSYVAQNTVSAEEAIAANGRLAESLYETDKQRLLFRLYGERGAIAKFSELPDTFVYALADEAVENRFLRRAAALTKHLNTPPPNVSPDTWELKQARLAVYSQDIDRAEQILQNWVSKKTMITAEEADRMLQVVFDLQAVDEHSAVLALLNQMQDRLMETRQQREVLYWRADSLRAQKRYEQAAESYLASAFSFGDVNDLWGQSARVKAAEAMTDAGLTDDARNVYKALLRITQDRSQRAELTRRLQKLLLKQPPESSTEEQDT